VILFLLGLIVGVFVWGVFQVRYLEMVINERSRRETRVKYAVNARMKRLECRVERLIYSIGEGEEHDCVKETSER
jgi:hypothetical protein